MVAQAREQRLDQAAQVLPRRLRLALQELPEPVRARVEEVRLRAGRPMAVVTAAGEVSTGMKVEREDLELTLEVASQRSAYAVADQVRQGFLTVRGGHRIGLCGAAVVKEGRVTGLRQLSSLALRVAGEAPGAAAQVLPQVQEGGAVLSTLILSPPGRGKTTLLRDLIRCISDGEGVPPLRVGVADERRELAALWEGVPQLDVGGRTDVMDGCPKAEGLLMLLRGMNPQVLAADEITAPADVAAMETAAGCGTALLATAHAGGLEDLGRRPLYRELMELGIFQRIVEIDVDAAGARTYRVRQAAEVVC